MTKTTYITSIKSSAPVKPAPKTDGGLALYKWLLENMKTYGLRGHWAPDKAVSFAARRGRKVEEILHHSSHGADRKFVVIGGVVQAVQC